MPFRLERAEQVLQRTPRVLRAMLDGLDPEWTGHAYGPDTWSPREVVAHLVFGEMTDWIPRARRILDSAGRVPFDPFDRAGHRGLMQGKSIDELLDEFERRRAESLAALRAMRLAPADLARRGTHPALGPVTLAQLLAAWVVHDLNHIAQIAKGVAFQHRAEVGPWEAYLSILAPPNPR
ncbi:MAG TPA: hypothetical protein DEB06_02635 [Phycisphaerales bacterium]|nr:hypothetical protein [Phycisphaerales bacterium]